ncbi:MAG: methyltransferase domain-containing protein [Patescibacteria group bacterium]
MVRHLLKGDFLDFGGNKEGLKKYVKSNYTVVNCDHSEMNVKYFDTIVALAVIEHMSVPEIYNLFKNFKHLLNANGHILITTPTINAKPVLELIALVGLAEKNNIAEHKHYRDKKELFELAQEAGFFAIKYIKFQMGFNQFVIMEHAHE